MNKLLDHKYVPSVLLLILALLTLRISTLASIVLFVGSLVVLWNNRNADK